jgi:hypothetical protein
MHNSLQVRLKVLKRGFSVVETALKPQLSISSKLKRGEMLKLGLDAWPQDRAVAVASKLCHIPYMRVIQMSAFTR